MTTHPTTPPSTDRPPDDPRARLFGFVEAGAIEEDLPTFAAAVEAYRASELRDFLWRLEQSSGDQVAAKLVEENPEWAELLSATEATT